MESRLKKKTLRLIDMEALCDNCWYNSFDEESGEAFCSVILDEDELARLVFENKKGCKYFRPDKDDYSIVRKQN